MPAAAAKLAVGRCHLPAVGGGFKGIFTLIVHPASEANCRRIDRMKISGTGPLGASPVRRRDQARRTDRGNFASELGEKSSVATATPVQQTEALTHLLAAQEVGDEPGKRRSAQERAEFMLDQLDQLRHGLLAGRISGQQLSRLAQTVRQRRDHIADPRIREVLDEIELRVAVELAKLRKNV